MLKLGHYGSCSVWQGEEGIDVLFAHLLAPYARILVAVAPPDSEITDDAASQVAPPEFMQAVEYISVHHLANGSRSATARPRAPTPRVSRDPRAGPRSADGRGERDSRTGGQRRL